MLADIHQLLLSIKQSFTAGAVNKQVAVFSLTRNAEESQSVFEMSQIVHVFCHVCGEDHAEESLVENL